MNKISIVPFALVAISATNLMAASQSLPQEIEKLVQESHLSKPACEGFGKSVRELLKGQSGTPLPDRATARRLLALVKGYPGIPSAAKEVYAKVGDASLSGELSDEAVRAEVGVYACDVVAYFDAMRALILSSAPLRFSAKERAEIAGIEMRRISSDLGAYGTLIQVLIHEELLKMLIDDGILEVSDAIFVETLRLHEQIVAARSQLRVFTQKNPTSVESIATEFKLMRPPSESLQRLATRLLRRKDEEKSEFSR
jgi:hypothetical protein